MEARPKRAAMVFASFVAISGTTGWSIDDPSMSKQRGEWFNASYWTMGNEFGLKWAE
jgi:hypothetical protein